MKQPVFLAMLSFALLGISANCPAGKWAAEVIENLDQARIVLFLTDEDMAAMPEWRPDGHEPPPLTLAKAIDLVNAEIEKDVDLRGAEIHELEFKPVRKHEKQHRWYFLCEVRTHDGGKEKKHFLAVLTSGKVIRAIEEPTL